MNNKELLAVSACLLGMNCKYNGGNNRLPDKTILQLEESYCMIPICPEQLGGLPTPRKPAERQGETVVMKDGTDVTKQFHDGALAAQCILRERGVRIALLKSRSPSCGKDKIYDGSFTGTLKSGDGVTAELLRSEGIKVFTEQEINQLL